MSIENRRDGREHVLETPEDLETWLESFKRRSLLQPTKAFCDCCGAIHADRDTDGELFELCAACQAELAAFNFEQNVVTSTFGRVLRLALGGGRASRRASRLAGSTRRD